MDNTLSKHRSSSNWFSFWKFSNGYFNFGNGAVGQSKAGISSLWIALEWVDDKQPVFWNSNCPVNSSHYTI